VFNDSQADFWRDQLARALSISFAAKQSASMPAWGQGVLVCPLSTIQTPFPGLGKYNLVSLHVAVPACLIGFVSVLRPATGASPSGQPAGTQQISFASAPWTYDDRCPMHKACIQYQREVLQYILEGGSADIDQLRSLASYDDVIALHSVGHLQAAGDGAVTNDVYIGRLQCASAPLEEARHFLSRVLGADQSEYDVLAKRGNHGTYSHAVRNFYPPGPHLLRWAARSGRLSTVDEALRADSQPGPQRPHKRYRS